MRKFISDERGSVPIYMVWIISLLLLLVMLILEVGGAFENYDYCVDVLQRSCNSAVESNIDDSYRADRILLLDTAGAEADFLAFLADDLPDKYAVRIDSIVCTATPPSMEIVGEVTFDTMFAQYEGRSHRRLQDKGYEL